MAMTSMRGSEGYDFNLILTHYVFLLTSFLAVIGWFVAFVGQVVAQANLGTVGHQQVGVLWFAIFLQLAVILGVLHALATNSVMLHRFQISVFGSVALVFAVIGVNQGIFTNVGSLETMAAGWLILAIVDIIWLLYFTSEENSLSLHIFNYFGTGRLNGPGRNGFRPSGRLMAGSPASNMESGGGVGYGGGIGSVPEYGSQRMMGGDYDTKEPATMGGMGGNDRAKVDSSQRSIGGGGESILSNEPGGRGGRAPDSARSPKGVTPIPSPMSQTIAVPAYNPGGDSQNQSTPLMAPGTPGTSGDAVSSPEAYMYRARALYAYSASADDPNEISFSKGEILDIMDKTGKWWQARRADGSTGIAPSNYLQVV